MSAQLNTWADAHRVGEVLPDTPAPSPTPKTTGVGDTLKADILDPRRSRATNNTITGLANSGKLDGWDIPPDAFTKLPGWIMESAEQARAAGDARGLRAATRALTAIADHNLRRAEGLDKATRLDQGQSTDNVVFGKVKFRGGREVGVDRDGSHTGVDPD